MDAFRTFEVTGIESKQSKHGGLFYYLFLKRDDGKSFRTCLCPVFGNYKRWQGIVKKAQAGERPVLMGLRETKLGLIDADSQVKEVVNVP